MRFIALAACGLILSGGPVAVAAPSEGAQAETAAPSAAELRRGLAGRWAGALGYRDYQTDELFELPVTTTIVQVADGVTQVRTSLFDDGPGNPVWITSVSLHDERAGTVTSASYRTGRAVEPVTERLSIADGSDDRRWTLIYDSVGEDNDEPAEIRVTETRDGDSLMSVKTVRPVGADDSAWRFRNQTRLTRAGD